MPIGREILLEIDEQTADLLAAQATEFGALPEDIASSVLREAMCRSDDTSKLSSNPGAHVTFSQTNKMQ